MSAARRTFLAQPQFLEDLIWWVDTDPRIAAKILRMVEAVLRDPISGLGKPEPLKGAFQGCWSRRITQEHRLVCRLGDRSVDFLQCRYHYQ